MEMRRRGFPKGLLQFESRDKRVYGLQYHPESGSWLEHGGCLGDASELFLAQLTDPEVKRKIIGREFINIFDVFAHDLEKKLGTKPAYRRIQMSLNPARHQGLEEVTLTRSRVIIMWEGSQMAMKLKLMELKLMEPLKHLCKDEVDEMFIMSIKRRWAIRYNLASVCSFLARENCWSSRRPKDSFSCRCPSSCYKSRWHGMTADWYYFERKFLEDVSRKIYNSVRRPIARALLPLHVSLFCCFRPSSPSICLLLRRSPVCGLSFVRPAKE